MTETNDTKEQAIVHAEKTPPLSLLLLPGLLCDGTVWKDQFTALPNAVTCSVVDYGESSSISAMAAHALATAPPGRFAVAGHSMGGRVALEVMRQAPERVAGIALMDTGYQALDAGQAGDNEKQGRMRLLEIARKDGMRALGQAWAPGMVHPDRVGDEMFERILRMIERKTPAIFEAQIQALLGRPDAEDVLKAITCPALLLCGRQDSWSPLERHLEMQTLMPHAALVAVEDSGHMSTMEQPQAVSQAMLVWLANIENGSADSGRERSRTWQE